MFAASVGTIALVDLRLLGCAFRRESPAQLLKSTSLWTLTGLIVVITSGFIIWTSDPLRYYYNGSFRYKIIALLLAIIYNYTIHRKVAQSTTSPTFGSMLTATFRSPSGSRSSSRDCFMHLPESRTC